MNRWHKMGWVALWACACACTGGEMAGGAGASGEGNDPGGSGAGGDPRSPGTAGDGGAGGCARVDVLFAVDDSGSMRPKMEAISRDVFPAFAARLHAVGGGLEDFRVGVTSACSANPVLATRGDGGACGFSSGEAWIHSDSPALAEEFTCVGDIYSAPADQGGCEGDNDDEAPASTAVAALSAPWRDGANAGFLRDDALLVVVAITDEDETPVPDRSVDELYASLVALKGDAARLVFLGIGGSRECDEKAGAPETSGGAEEAATLMELTERFIDIGRGVAWDLCEGNFAEGLDEAMAIIDGACSEYPPLL